MKNITAGPSTIRLGGYNRRPDPPRQIELRRTLEPSPTPWLPSWMLHTRWKEHEDFLYAMTAKTVKLIGDLPVDKGQISCMVLPGHHTR